MSNELWYYVAFPCLWMAAFGAYRKWKRVAYASIAVLVLFGVGPRIAIYFPIWLFGCGVFLMPRLPLLSSSRVPYALAFASALLIATIASTHVGSVRAFLGFSMVGSDYITGLAFTAWLYVAIHHNAASADGRYARWSKWLADMSFTLYVVHMPLLVVTRAAINHDRPWPPDARFLIFALAICVLTTAYAYGVSRLTEAHTDRVRRAVSKG